MAYEENEDYLPVDTDDRRRQMLADLMTQPPSTPAPRGSSYPTPAAPDLPAVGSGGYPPVRSAAAPNAPTPNVASVDPPAPPLMPISSSQPPVNMSTAIDNTIGKRPSPSDYPAVQPSRLHSILSRFAAGAVGFKDPREGVAMRRHDEEYPQEQASQKYQQAAQDYNQRFGQTMQENTAEQEAPLRQAQTEEANARADALRNPPAKPAAPDKFTHEYVDDQGNEVGVSESGQTKVLGKAAAKPTASDIGKLAPEIEAQVGAPPDAKDYPGGAKDPKYKSDRSAWGKSAEGIREREAAASGAARGEGYNLSRPVQIIDENGTLRYVTAGEAEKQGVAPAAPGMKAMSQEAQFQDIKSATKNVRNALQALGNTEFTPSQVAKITLAMQETDPTVMHNEIASLAASGLTPKQQDLVTWLAQLNERALSLRNIAGMGQGSDTTRLAILKALPSITSGNVNLATKQLNALDNMVDNLHRGIAKVKGNSNQSGQSGGASGFSVDVGGKSYSFPNQKAADQFKKEAGVQ